MTKMCDQCFKRFVKDYRIDVNTQFEFGMVSKFRLWLVRRLIALAAFVGYFEFSWRQLGYVRGGKEN